MLHGTWSELTNFKKEHTYAQKCERVDCCTSRRSAVEIGMTRYIFRQTRRHYMAQEVKDIFSMVWLGICASATLVHSIQMGHFTPVSQPFYMLF